jgi:F0F1-type ATP synthase assembly protein I
VSEQPSPVPEDDPDRLKEFGRKGMEFADASVWLNRIFSAIAPGLIGLWIDNRYGTRYWALIGLVLGVTSGILSFRQATKDVFKKPDRVSSRDNKSSSGRSVP